jgi:membrane associated rhomboid family serine protease
MLIPLRDETPFRRVPAMTAALVAANLAVFFYFRLQGGPAFQAAVFRLGLIPRELWAGNLELSPGHSFLASIFSSMFMHAGLVHLGGNMLFLWIFGNGVEDELGRLRFLFYYLGCGAVAALVHVGFNLRSAVPMVGASGAISGVLGAYLYRFGWARVRVLAFLLIFPVVFRVPAWLLIGLWFAMQVLSGLPTLVAAPVSGVAYLAHVGGFIAGYWYMRRRRSVRRAVYSRRRGGRWGMRP